MRKPNLLYFYSHIKVTDDCWLWTGSLNDRGYGMWTWGWKKGDKRTVRVNRFVYEIFYGPIPEGLTIDHLCRTRACVRPDHLEAVTHMENCHRRPLRDICKRGLHDLNVHGIEYPPKVGRTCHPCRIAYSRRRNERIRQQKLQGVV